MLNARTTQGLTSNKILSKNGLYIYEIKRIMSVAHSALVDVIVIFDHLTSD